MHEFIESNRSSALSKPAGKGELVPRKEGEVVIVPVSETVAVVGMGLLLTEEVSMIRRQREIARGGGCSPKTSSLERKKSDRGHWRQESPD